LEEGRYYAYESKLSKGGGRRTRKRTRRRRGGDVLADAKKYKDAIKTWKMKKNNLVNESYDDPRRAAAKLTTAEGKLTQRDDYDVAKWYRIQEKYKSKAPNKWRHPDDFDFWNRYNVDMPIIISKMEKMEAINYEYNKRLNQYPTPGKIEALNKIVKDMETYPGDEYKDILGKLEWLGPAMKNLAGGRKKSRRKSRRRKKSTKKKRRRRKKRSRRRRK
jgi:hypothetical protein